MKRRDFFRAAPFVQTRPRVRWRLASSYPRSLDTIYGATEAFAARVAALTEDHFRVQVYPAGELVPGLEVLDSVQKGTVHMGQSASYYYIGKNPALAFDTSVPFGLTARQQNAWMTYGGGLDLMRALFADFNIINLPGGNTGTQMGGWFRRELGSVADLKGLKMRIPGLGGRVMDRLGVTVQVLAGGDIYPALERGAIDATEWVGPYDDEKLGFHRVARYYYYPGWWEPGPQLALYVNRDAWDRLPVTYQQVLEAASAEMNVSMLANYDAKNPPALARLLAEDIVLRSFPDDIMRASYAASEALMEEAASDPTYNRVYTAFKEWRASTFRWSSTAEQTYAAYAFNRVGS